MVEGGKEKLGFDTSGLRQEAMERLRSRHGTVAGMGTRDIQALIHELEVHQVELEVQNEELRRAQVELAEARDQYLDLYEFAPVGYLTLDAAGVITRANLTAVKLCNIERDKLIGKRLEKLIVREDRDACYLALREASHRETKPSCELRMQCDGSIFWASLEMVAVRSPDSEQCVGYRVTVTDVTARRQAEEALRAAKGELEQRVVERTAELSETIDTLQTEIGRRKVAEEVLQQRSEQLRLLASELTMAEQRERRRLATILHDDLQQLLVGAKFRLSLMSKIDNESVKQATAEVQKLIDESIERSRSLTVELSPQILHQGGLVPALQWLAVWMQERHGLVIEFHAADAATPESEDMKILLFQSVRELLFNVVKHARVKTARITVQKVDGRIEVVVSDTGVGFDPQVALKRGSLGGFGLFSICQRLELLGGAMGIESAPDRGSRVTLRAPLIAGLPSGDSRVSQAPQSLAGAGLAQIGAEPAQAQRNAGRKIRTLLVDDHVVMRQGLSHLLREEPDIEIVGEASDGRMAVELVGQLHPDVVTMDVSMPVMDGIEATRIIHSQFPDVRVIGLSMFEEGQCDKAMRDAGAADYVVKSGPSDALISAIRAVAKAG